MIEQDLGYPSSRIQDLRIQVFVRVTSRFRLRRIEKGKKRCEDVIFVKHGEGEQHREDRSAEIPFVVQSCRVPGPTCAGCVSDEHSSCSKLKYHANNVMSCTEHCHDFEVCHWESPCRRDGNAEPCMQFGPVDVDSAGIEILFWN